MRLGDTPVLIPNTMVKTKAADGTMLETAWESRWLPDSFGNNSKEFYIYSYFMNLENLIQNERYIIFFAKYKR